LGYKHFRILRGFVDTSANSVLPVRQENQGAEQVVEFLGQLESAGSVVSATLHI
jgi:hypothetical protein